MSTCIDFHVHLYPEFDLEQAFDAALASLKQRLKQKNTSENPEEVQFVLCLTERFDCNVFQTIAKGAAKLGAWKLAEKKHSTCLELLKENSKLYLVSGRQIATREKLELLLLASDPESYPKDGQSLEELLSELTNFNAIGALSYGFGKWTGARGEKIKKILSSNSYKELAICDTAMRPQIPFTPKILQRAFSSNRKVFYGSDPLPLPGEEKLLGTYAGYSKERFNPEDAQGSLRRIISKPQELICLGSRRSLFRVIKDTIRLAL